MSEPEQTEAKPAPVITAELFQVDADLPSGNRYPMNIVMDAIREIKPHMVMGKVLGEFNPPTDAMEVRSENAATLVKNMYFQGDVLMADLEILPTPKGELLKTWLRAGGEIKVTPRGVGSAQVQDESEDEVYVVQSYTFITVDVYPVRDPDYCEHNRSTFGTCSECDEDPSGDDE